MKAIILLSGGIDSCVVLASAISKGIDCVALSYNYGQRHLIELESAKRIAAHYEVKHHIISIDTTIFQSASSSLIDFSLAVTQSSVYVPCRNLLFLSLAASFAESHEASSIYFGSNAEDVQNFPDCEPRFLEAVQRAITLGSKSHISIVYPLSSLSKTQIKALGRSLNAPLSLTWSCYQPVANRPCGQCHACLLAKD